MVTGTSSVGVASVLTGSGVVHVNSPPMVMTAFSQRYTLSIAGAPETVSVPKGSLHRLFLQY